MSEPLTKEYLRQALSTQLLRLTVICGVMLAGFAVAVFTLARSFQN